MPTRRINWLTKCALDGPFVLVDPRPNGELFYSSDLSPLCKAPSFSIKGDEPVGSFVSGLLDWSGPSAILRAIRSIVVNSIEGAACTRLITHVGGKAGKIKPSIAYGYTPASVQAVGGVKRVCTPTDHVMPKRVKRRSAASVSDSCRAVLFSKKASARFGRTISYRAASDDGLISAGTMKEPYNNTPFSFSNGGNRSKPVEFLARYIGGVAVQLNRGKMYLSHIGTRFINVVRGLPVVAGSAPNYTTMPSNSWRFV